MCFFLLLSKKNKKNQKQENKLTTCFWSSSSSETNLVFLNNTKSQVLLLVFFFLNESLCFSRSGSLETNHSPKQENKESSDSSFGVFVLEKRTTERFLWFFCVSEDGVFQNNRAVLGVLRGLPLWCSLLEESQEPLCGFKNEPWFSWNKTNHSENK